MNKARAEQLGHQERWRIWWAGCRYDFWLDLRDVPGKERRALRHELKANLTAAAEDDGIGQALSGVGSLRDLAGEYEVRDASRVRWGSGLACAVLAAACGIAIVLIAAFFYGQGVVASGGDASAASTLWPFWGTEIEVNTSSESFTSSIQFGPFPLLLAVVAFLGVARPWRLLKRQSSDRSMH